MHNAACMHLCPAGAAHDHGNRNACSKGQAILQLAMSKQAHKFGLASAGPEILLCRRCFKLEKRQYQRCGRCMGPPYCSIECQKADWKQHKPHCVCRQCNCPQQSLLSLTKMPPHSCDRGTLAHNSWQVSREPEEAWPGIRSGRFPQNA